MKNFFTFKSDMRKTLVALLLMVSFSGILKAQYVTIPDTAFVSWLHNNGLASCMSGNQLDTTCTALFNITSLQCFNVPIRDLTGAQYFKNATELDCHNDSLYTIPVLPPSLTLLTCYSNNLSTLPAFPASLTTIACWKNRFATLPTLPPFLTQLECQQNQLTALPALPATLTSLSCYSNQLTAIPNLPGSLASLDCSSNQLGSLPVLPPTLAYLFCQNNQLISLPVLPDSLYQFYCYNNANLTCLPAIKRIVYFQFNGTAINCVPDYGTVTNSTPLITTLPLCQPGNANGCITAPALHITTAGRDTICFGTSANLTCNITGGTAPFTYSWTPATNINSTSTQSVFVNPPVRTTYTVLVTDSNHITVSASVTVSVYTNLSASIAGGSTPICTNTSPGTFTATGQGGSGSYAYQWYSSSGAISNATSSTFAPGNLAASNTYYCGVTDNGFCGTANTSATSITVNNCPGVNAGINQSICQGQSVIIGGSPTASGGTAPYNYAWAPASGLSSASVANPSATPANTTTYTVTVTDANSNTGTSSVTITVNPVPQVSSLNVTNIRCYGTDSGAVCPTVTGGSFPYTFMWSNSTASQCITGLTAGTYYITAIDSRGCQVRDSATVTQATQIHDSIVITNASCLGATNGAACVYSSGGFGNITYNWNNGSTSQCITGLTAGAYIVQTTDANGCSVSATGVVFQPALLHPSISITNVTCNGGNNGLIIFTSTTGGTQPYQFSIDGITFQPSGQFTNLIAGDYLVKVRDAMGCSAYQPDTITQPTPIHDSLAITNVTCNGRSDGSVCIYPTGGSAPYFYQWSNGATGQCITGLSIGTYITTVIDANSCTATSSATINQPSALLLNVTATGTLVLPDTANLTVSGGTGPYSVTWGDGQSNSLPGSTDAHIYDTAGVYVISVSDAHSCNTIYTLLVDTVLPLVANAGNNTTICLYHNVILGGNPTARGGTAPYNYAWSDGAAPVSNPVAAPSINHTYTLTVTDANSVSATASITITVGPGLNAAFNSISPICAGTFANFTDLSNPAVGITSWYWDFGNGNTSAIQNPTEPFLTGGVYPVKLSVTNSVCTADTIISFTVNNIPTSTFTATSPVCPGQNATITYTGSASVNGLYTWNFDGATIASGTGEGPYQLSWTTGGTKNITLTITDNGCNSTMTTVPVTVNGNLSIDSIVATNARCFGDTGAICVYATGTGPLNYMWSSGVSGNFPCISNISAGTYVVSITQNAGCTATATATVYEPAALTDSTQTTNICSGSLNGAICIYPSGGTTPYSYTWANGATSQCITGLTTGTYGCTIVDANGCYANAFPTVYQSPGAMVQDSFTHSGGVCYGSGGVTLCEYVSGGTPPYTYRWTNSATTQCAVTNLQQNWVVYTDALGCSDSTFIVIPQPSPLTVQVMAPDSNAIPDSVSLIIRGGTTPYSIIWGDGQSTNLPDSTASHIYVSTGIYIDTITDRNGCVTTYRTDAGCTDQCVWPGDANYDGIVDNNDLLSIGLGYDTTGYARINPTINFIPQYCQSWADTLIGAINYKHVDCNGDGIINADDTSAIILNYSLTHARGGSGGIWKIDAPALYIKTSPDTIADGEILTATLSLGNAAMPVSNVYGLAFSYNFDPLVVDTTDVHFNVGNSWLFGPGDHINISKNFYQQGKLQAAITRIDHANRSGYGPIATVSMKITTGNINGKNLLYYFMNNFISNLTVIDNAGHNLIVNAGTDSAVVSYTPTSIIPVKNGTARIQIFPNPANDQLNIISGLSEIEEITIVDLAGQKVMQLNRLAGNYSAIDISELSAGVYLIKLKTSTDEYRSRFVKIASK